MKAGSGGPCAHVVLFAPLPDERIPAEESAASEFARRASEMLGKATRRRCWDGRRYRAFRTTRRVSSRRPAGGGEGGTAPRGGGDLVRRGRVRPSGRVQARPGARFLVVIVVVVTRRDDYFAAEGRGRSTCRRAAGTRGLSQFVRPDGMRNLPARVEAGEVARRGEGRRDAPGDAGGIGAAGCQFRSIHTETWQ